MAFSREFIFPEREGRSRDRELSREREFQEEREFIFPEREIQERERGSSKGGLVFKLGFQTPPQWWS